MWRRRRGGNGCGAAVLLVALGCLLCSVLPTSILIVILSLFVLALGILSLFC